MTRKRFIKLAMSQGVSRNVVVGLAEYYNRRNIPYKNAYCSFLIRVGVSNSFKRLGEAIGKTGESLSSVTSSLNKLGKALQNALSQ